MLKLKWENKGFSLLEVIITVAILAAGITVLLQALSFSSRVAGLSNDIIRAVFLAEDRLQELGLKEKQGLIGGEPVLNLGEEGRFNWQGKLNFDTDINLYKFDLAVSWQRADRAEEINAGTYFK